MRFSTTISKLTVFLLLITQLIIACGAQQPIDTANDIAANITAVPPTCNFGFFTPSANQSSIDGVGEFTFQWAEQPGATFYVLTIDSEPKFSEGTSGTTITVNMDQFTEPGPYLATVTAITAENTILCNIYHPFTINLGVVNCQLAWINPAPDVVNIVNVATKFDWVDEPQAIIYALSITTPSNETIDYVSLSGSQKIIELSIFTEEGEYTVNLKALKDQNTLICEITRKFWILQTKSGENDQGGNNNGGNDKQPIPTATNPPPG